MRGFGAFIAAAWLALVMACVVGVVFVLKTCSSDEGASKAARSNDTGPNEDARLPDRDPLKAQARLEEIQVTTIRSLAGGWKPILNSMTLEGLEFLAGRTSYFRPLQLNLALMSKPQIQVLAPWFEDFRYKWPELWFGSGNMRVRTDFSTGIVKHQELDGMTSLSYTSRAGISM
jgi:hypothetical protein